MKKYFALFLLLAVDVVSKLEAVAWIPSLKLNGYPFGGIGIFSNFLGISFSLNRVVNTGAVCGFFSGHSALLFGLRVLVIAFLLYYLTTSRKQERNFALWLVVTGAIGNAIDYCLYGYVIDFFHFHFWGYSFPIFNCADSYISIGVGLLFLTRSFRVPKIV